MKKILMIFGTRPEAIKMAPVFNELNDDFDVKICVTGQHDSMLHQVLNIFDLKPDFDLKIMKPNQKLSKLSSGLLEKLDNILEKVNPDIVLVHGDTSSCLCASLTAFYNNIPVCHVEAGLRTHDVHSPFPEEFNRQVTSKIASLHFAPTPLNKQNLIDENVDQKNIYITGNTVIDALKFIANRIDKNQTIKHKLQSSIYKTLGFKFDKSKFVLITGHRRENFGQGFNNICKGIRKIAKEFNEVKFVYPVHLNPNVVKPVTELLGNVSNIILCDPLEYEEFVLLMKESYLILTDSGGIQEEAPFFNVPVLVMRDKTERVEALDAGTVKLVGTDSYNIYESMKNLLLNSSEYKKMSNSKNPYGVGDSALTIKKILKRSLF